MAAAESTKKDYLFAGHAPAVRAAFQVDDVALYSVTPAWMTAKICAALLAKVGRDARVTDGTACVGGDTMAFAAVFAHVVAVEANADRAAMCAANVAAAGLADKVTVLHADYVNVRGCWQQDVVFLDAPWGGPEYWKTDALDLYLEHGGMQEPLADVCAAVWPATRVIALKVPSNFGHAAFLARFKELVAPVGVDVIYETVNMRKAVLVMLSK